MDDRRIAISDRVIDAINDELHYISTLNAQGRSDETHHGTAGQLLTLKVYVDKAIAAWVLNPGDKAALDELRKCAAIAVRAMITEGTVFREWHIPDGS
jgi:hypothetical protein